MTTIESEKGFKRRDPDLRRKVTVILAAEMAEARSRLGGLRNSGAASRAVRALEASIRKSKRIMVEINIPLAVSIARSHCGAGREIEDLVQDACLGLLRAVDGFESHRGVAFSTYATWWIRRAVLRSVSRPKAPPPMSPEPSEPPFEEALLSKNVVEAMLGRLEKTEADVIAARFCMQDQGDGDLETLGKKLGLSIRDILQIERRALSRLRGMAGVYQSG